MKGEDTTVALTDRPQKVGPPDGSSGQTPPSSVPRPYNWRATVGLIVAIVVVAGAMGVFMRVIPTPFTQPTPTSAPTVRPTAQPAVAAAPATLAPRSAPLAAPTFAPTDFARNQPGTVAPAAQPATPPGAPATVGLVIGPLAAPTAPPTDSVQSQPATVAPATQPTHAPTTVPQPTPAPASATTVQPATEPTVEPTSQATAAPTVDPALAAEILPAYQHYWEIRDEALATLDGTRLSEVMYGIELVAAQTYIDQLRGQGKAVDGSEDHSITIVSAIPDDAVIHDVVVDHSVFVDPTTREPLPPDQQSKPDTEIDATYHLRNIDGVWKVVEEG